MSLVRRRVGLTVSVGDALLFTAVGVRVRSGADAVTIVGPFAPGVIGDDGHVLAPAGPPNAVMVIAKQAGRAAIDVISGDPWHLASRATGNWRRSAVSRSSKGVMKEGQADARAVYP